MVHSDLTEAPKHNTSNCLISSNNYSICSIFHLLLIPNLGYKVRAFATKSVNTSYGEEVTFTTAITTSIGGINDKVINVYANGDNNIMLVGSETANVMVFNYLGQQEFAGKAINGINNRSFAKGLYIV